MPLRCGASCAALGVVLLVLVLIRALGGLGIFHGAWL